jgi:hypothetical protein
MLALCLFALAERAAGRWCSRCKAPSIDPRWPKSLDFLCGGMSYRNGFLARQPHWLETFDCCCWLLLISFVVFFFDILSTGQQPTGWPTELNHQ